MRGFRVIAIILIFCSLFLFLQSCTIVFSKIGSPVYERKATKNKSKNLAVVINPDLNLGKQINQEILRTRIVLNNKNVENYVNTVGKKLAYSLEETDIPFEFIVIRDLNINAFVSPGGYVYITTGMLKFLNSESELAAVLAHEMAHVIAKHHVKLALSQMGIDLTLDYLGKLLNYNPQTTVPKLTGFVILQKFSRMEETQADEIGTYIMVRSGYSPYGLIKLLQSLQNIERTGILSNFISSHPTSTERIQHIQAYINKNNLNQPGLIIDKSVFHEITDLL